MAITINGTPQATTGTSVTLPSHASGDIIVIFAYRDGSGTPPSTPAASGTVPAWSVIDAPTTGTNNSLKVAKFVATANNHTSGTWTNATGMAAIVLRGAGGIGAHAQGGSSSENGQVSGVAITPQMTDGSSLLLYFYGHQNVTAWGTAPSAYTRRASAATEVCLNTKDSSTADGAKDQSCTTSAAGASRSSVVEILLTGPDSVDGVAGVATASSALSKLSTAVTTASGAGTAWSALSKLSMTVAPPACAATASASAPTTGSGGTINGSVTAVPGVASGPQFVSYTYDVEIVPPSAAATASAVAAASTGTTAPAAAATASASAPTLTSGVAAVAARATASSRAPTALGGTPAPAATGIRIVQEMAFGSRPFDAAYNWTIVGDTDDPDHVIGWSYDRGRENESQRVAAGTGRLHIGDDDSVFDPRNTASPYYPDVKLRTPVRQYAVVDGDIYPMFQHYVSRFPRTRRETSVWTERDLSTVDGFALLAQADIAAEYATLTTTFGGDSDLTFTAAQAGEAGNSISVRYVVRTFSGGVSAELSGTDITVYVDGTSETAGSVRNAILNDITGLINVELAPGSSGAGVVPTMTTTFLAGGGGAEYPEESSGDRIGRVLDRAGWPSALRNIDDGAATIGESTFTDAETKALTHIQEVGDTENGLTFIDADGDLRHVSRHALLVTPYADSQVTFNDTRSVDTDFIYQTLVPTFDDDQIANEWIGTREGGVPQAASDQDSIDDYGRTTRSFTSLASSDAAVLAQAQWKVAVFKDPFDRIASITVRPGYDTDLWVSCLEIDVGSRITVSEQPPGYAAPLVTDYVVQRLRVAADHGVIADTVFEFELWPADIQPWLIMDDPVRGRVDFNVVAY